MLDDIGKLSEPATRLIEKVSDGIGGLCRPFQTRHMAKAKRDAAIIAAEGQIAITEMQRQAVLRFVGEQGRHQENMTSIIARAIPQLEDSSSPEDVENDWIASFFAKGRYVSNEQMQSLWAKVLAGEANSPGTFSRRTVNLLESFDQEDAQLFTAVCRCTCLLDGDPEPFIYSYAKALYKDVVISYATMMHLDNIGLIHFSADGFRREGLPKEVQIYYCGARLRLEFREQVENDISVGQVLLTEAGRQLYGICEAEAVDGFLDYVIGKWSAKGIIISSPYPRAE